MDKMNAGESYRKSVSSMSGPEMAVDKSDLKNINDSPVITPSR